MLSVYMKVVAAGNPTPLTDLGITTVHASPPAHITQVQVNMAKSVTIGHLVCSSKEARDKVIQAFSTIAQYSKENEAGVSQYAITVPVEDDEKSIYMIEE